MATSQPEERPHLVVPESGQGVLEEELTIAPFSDDALALRFSDFHTNDLRYTAKWGRWSMWDGARWKTDETCRVSNLVRQVCREAGYECNGNMAHHVASAAKVAAVERMARNDRRHAAEVDQWDSKPWLLNTPAGAVELQTGKIRSADPRDYLTKITAVAPNLDGCPIWLGFLKRVTNDDPDLVGFLQRMCGYALTGLTREHALFFLYGTGGNGKSVFLNTISGILGDYVRSASIETFIATRNEHHPTDLAGLHGARLVTAVETEEGRNWAESKVKALTGGDRITARFMRQDFFDFTPQFKMMIAGNHKPGLRTVDEAMRRRFNFVPFTVTIPASERDKELADRMRSEWGGILQWMIDGCAAWQSEGLKPPSVVSRATCDYLESEDALGRWLDECCVRDNQICTSVTTLFESWEGWCKENREPLGSVKRFSQVLEARDFIRERSSSMRRFRGIGLRGDSV